LTLAFDDALHSNAGAPAVVEVNVTLGNKLVDVTLVALNKTATRLAEAMWLSFMPLPNLSPAEWAMDVLGSPVSPMEVLTNATRHIHAVWAGVTWTGPAERPVMIRSASTPRPPPGAPTAATAGATTLERRLHIRALDSALVSPTDIHHLLR